MKVKELPPVISEEIEIYYGAPLTCEYGDVQSDTYEICNYGPIDNPQDYMYESFINQSQNMWNAIIEDYGEQEVLAIESDYDGHNMVRLYIEGGHS